MVLACLVTCLRTASRPASSTLPAKLDVGEAFGRVFALPEPFCEASESALNTLGHQVSTNFMIIGTSGRHPVISPILYGLYRAQTIRPPPLPGAPAVGSSRPAGSHRDPCSLIQSPPGLAHISRSTQRIHSHSAHPRIAHGLSQPSSPPRRMRPRPRPPHRARSPARGLRTHRRRAPA